MSTVLIRMKIAGLLLALFISTVTSAQPLADHPALQQYITEGLSNNLVLQQRTIQLDKAMLALKTANALFLPSVDASAAYQTGDGGRFIDLPIGDLLNPVYSTLNQLTSGNSFPQVENVEQSFFPFNFYDVKLHTVMPLFNSTLVYNRKIEQQKSRLSELDVQTYKRALIRDIKTAWYQYHSAAEAVKIYESVLTLAEEGERVNRSLLDNGKAVPAFLLRSQAEVENVQASLEEARRAADNARMYFNFLLNRDLAATIVTGDWSLPAQLTETNTTNVSGREELLSLQQGVAISETVLKLNRAFAVPQLGAFADIGFQADNMQFNSRSDYYLVGVQLSLPLFHGWTNRHRINAAKLDVQLAGLREMETKKALAMSITAANNRLSSALRSYRASVRQKDAAVSYHRLVEKGYREGTFSFIEMLDARNQLSTSQLQENIAILKVLTAQADLEREAATLSIP